MKHVLYVCAAAALLCASCAAGDGDGADAAAREESTPLALQTAAEETLSLAGAEGKRVFALLTNPTDTLIAGGRLRTITATSGIEGAPCADAGASASLCAALPAARVSASASADGSGSGNAARAAEPEGAYFVPPVPRRNGARAASARGAARAAAAAEGIAAPTKLAQPAAGVTTMQLWVDTDPTVSNFGRKQATLRAVGNSCYVWIVDDYYTEDAVSAETATNKANTAIAERFAAAFDALYPVERALFGAEPETVLYGDAAYSTMEAWSATGSMVNIVLYDIGRDYGFPLAKGVMGYFYDKDYYIPVPSGDLRYSNQGKYFYVDTYYAVRLPDTTLSTLAHEFQHMIGFGVDKSADGEETETWYHELLALLAEDALCSFLQLPESASPRSRLVRFNADYALSGIEYNTAEGSLSYATLYAFGAWLSRNFGGAAFIRELAQNRRANVASFVSAVNACNGTAYTFADLLRLYTQALVDSAAPYSLNKAPAASFRYEDAALCYDYPLAPIDLWSDAYCWTTDDYAASALWNERTDGGSYRAPALFNPAAVAPAVRPRGFVLYQLGTASEETVTVTLSAGSAAVQCRLLALD